jgi:hypothetical protein
MKTRHYERERAKRAEAYYARKTAQLCVECGVDLADGEGVCCDICAKAKAKSNSRYWRSAKHRKRHNERQRRDRAARIAAQLCVRCPKPTNGQRVLCDSHAADQSARDARRRAMAKQGITPITSARKPRQPKYIPLDELLDSPKVRLLRAIRTFEWAMSAHLMEYLGVPSKVEDKRVHDVYSQHLARLVHGGLVERRGLKPMCQYRITSAGRNELERIYALEKSA